MLSNSKKRLICSISSLIVSLLFTSGIVATLFTTGFKGPGAIAIVFFAVEAFWFAIYALGFAWEAGELHERENKN